VAITVRSISVLSVVSNARVWIDLSFTWLSSDDNTWDFDD
jgi:hypothetical protein